MFFELRGEVTCVRAGGASVYQCGLFLDSCRDVISHQERWLSSLEGDGMHSITLRASGHQGPKFSENLAAWIVTGLSFMLWAN